MLSHFSFMSGKPDKNSLACRVSEVTRPQQELVRLCSRPLPRTEGAGQLN